MIGKVGLGNFAKGILSYCYYEKELTAKQLREVTIDDVRGELIYIQHLGINTMLDGRLDLDYLAKQMLDNRDKNRNLNKYVWHQSFSFPPGEDPSTEKLTSLVVEFAKEFGFAEIKCLPSSTTTRSISTFILSQTVSTTTVKTPPIILRTTLGRATFQDGWNWNLD